MINATQIRKGMVILLNDKLYRVEDMEHITPGKGNAVVQTKIRDLADLTIRNFRFRSTERVEDVTLDIRELTYSYQDGEHYVFMDTQTYDQLVLDRAFLEPVLFYLKENEIYLLESYKDAPMNLTPPIYMEFTVCETEKQIKGAQAQASFKPAKLDNGMEIMVPPFVDVDNVVKVDTRTSTYVERVAK